MSTWWLLERQTVLSSALQGALGAKARIRREGLGETGSLSQLGNAGVQGICGTTRIFDCPLPTPAPQPQFHSTETYKRGDWQEGNVARWLRAWALTDRPGFISGRRLPLSELQFPYLQNGDITTHCIGPLWEWNEIMLVKKWAQVDRKRRVLGVVWVGGKRRTQNWSPNLWFQHKANYFLISSNSLFLTGTVRRVRISHSPPGRQGEHAGGGKHLCYPSLVKNERWVRLMASGTLQIAFYFVLKGVGARREDCSYKP